ncbi:MAG: 50S ribosomal protein L9 [Patescibacteria group bacterium]
MKILIIQDVKNLGKKGEIKEVSDGYARNFLLPQKIAVAATKKEIQKIEIEKQRQEKNQKQKIQNAEELKTKIKGMKIEIQAKANEKGALFAALNQEEIAKTLSEKIIQEIKPEQIILEKPIKEIGEYEIRIKLFANTETKIIIIVKS